MMQGKSMQCWIGISYMNSIVIEHFSPPSDAERLKKMLEKLNEVLIPKLSDRLDISEYAKKLAKLADVFYAVKDGQDIGNCAVYLNNADYGFISSVAVKEEYHRNGIGKKLLDAVKTSANSKGISLIRLEVSGNNFRALNFYKKMGFDIAEKKGDWIIMQFDNIWQKNNEQIILPSTSIMLTEFCTLRCKLCLAYVPYYKEKSHLLINDARVIISNYFQIVDMVEKFSMTGGEPLLNPDLNEILKEIKKYEDRIVKEIILITNGTILLSEETLKIMKEIPKLKVIVNYYGELSVYSAENKKKLDAYEINNILYTEDNRYGWIDCRDHSLKHGNITEREYQASKCAFFRGKKYIINRGRLYTCTRASYRIQENLIPYTEDDFVDLTACNASISDQREKVRKLLRCKSTVSCAYCDGLTENSVKYKAAEQL